MSNVKYNAPPNIAASGCESRSLYIASDNRKIEICDIVEALSFIKKGDAIFVHSDITPFGKLAITDRAWFFNSLIDSFLKVVGEDGVLLMPVFTYSFCKQETYDVQRSASTVGVLSEAFRRQPSVFRNMHPIFSVAGRGRFI
jgi:aminoglycoside 3-N-acetyltransferase